MKESCKSCKNFSAVPLQPGVGECRRRAPVALPMNNNGQIALQRIWPPVQDSEWCGEYAGKLEAVAAS